jgi:hypothetical protein
MAKQMRQRHPVRGPVVAGMIDAVGERPAWESEDVVLVAGGRGSTRRLAPRRVRWHVGRCCGLAMQIGDVAGYRWPLTLYHGPVLMRSRALIRGVLPRCSWPRYACQVRVAAC